MEKPTTILHISDLHFGQHSEQAWQNLREFVKQEPIDLIAVTGDLTEHPFCHARQARRELESLEDILRTRQDAGSAKATAEKAEQTTSSKGSAPRLLVVPGNHDFSIFGNGLSRYAVMSVSALAFISRVGHLSNYVSNAQSSIGAAWISCVCELAGWFARNDIVIAACIIVPTIAFALVTRVAFYCYYGRWWSMLPWNRWFWEKDRKIIFFSFNSNPWIQDWARGKIGLYRLWWFERLCDRLSGQDGKGFRESFKIALLHHHPLPIPYSEQLESFMVLVDSDHFLRSLAQKQVDIVLHGHKHNQALSRVKMGTVASGDREIAVLACGSTSRKDASSHSCNLVTIFPGGYVSVRKVVAQPGNLFATSSPISLPRPIRFVEMENVGNTFVSDRMRVVLNLDGEGNAEKVMLVEGLRLAVPKPTPGIKLTQTVSSGVIKDPSMDVSRSPRQTPCKPAYVEVDPGSGLPRKALYSLGPWDPADDPLEIPTNFETRQWELNAFAMNQEEWVRKYNRSRGDHPLEGSAVPVRIPTKKLEVDIFLPSGFELGKEPKLQFYSKSDAQMKEPIAWLGDFCAPDLRYIREKNLVTFAISDPPLGKYRIAWALPPPPTGRSLEPRVQVETEAFQRALLGMRADSGLQTLGNNAMDDLCRAVVAARKTALVNHSQVEASLMVYDNLDPTKIPKLVIVAHNSNSDPTFCEFGLEVGDGTAGAAFKTNRPQNFVNKRQAGEKPDPYVERNGKRTHAVLYSIPLRAYPNDKETTIGVVNIGSYETGFMPSTGQEMEMGQVIGNQIYPTLWFELNKLCKFVVTGVADDTDDNTVVVRSEIPRPPGKEF